MTRNVTIPIRSADYNATFGGGSSYSTWAIEAARGETTGSLEIGDWLHVVQEDGSNSVGVCNIELLGLVTTGQRG
jgi:hypothetical protein